MRISFGQRIGRGRYVGVSSRVSAPVLLAASVACLGAAAVVAAVNAPEKTGHRNSDELWTAEFWDWRGVAIILAYVVAGVVICLWF